jgi:hypothetical protein
VYEIGDAVLFTLSAWRQCSWQKFRRTLDDLHIQSLSVSSDIALQADANIRLNAARTLDSLGHCEVTFGAEGNVSVAPSVLAALPVAGLPRAVLCGSRSPETVAIMRSVARAKQSVQVTVTPQARSSPFAPARIEVQASTGAVLEQLAEDLGILYEAIPPAWSLASSSSSVETFLQSLTWLTRPDLTWTRVDFDPDHLRFGGHRDSGPLILARYQDPVRGRWVFRLWRENQSADINDPSWGRYAVLAAFGRIVLGYDPMLGELGVPLGVPLPRLFSRAISLCSGFAASVTTPRHGADGSAIHSYHEYHSVPEDLYSACAKKIGQLPLP